MFDARKLLDMLVQGGSNATGGGQNLQGMLGQVGGIVGQVLNQATAGVKQGAAEVDQTTGISQKATDMVQQTTGQSPADLLNRAKALAAQNPLATGAALGGLAAVLLGTGAGRAITGSVARMASTCFMEISSTASANSFATKPMEAMVSAAMPASTPKPIAFTNRMATMT